MVDCPQSKVFYPKIVFAELTKHCFFKLNIDMINLLFLAFVAEYWRALK